MPTLVKDQKTMHTLGQDLRTTLLTIMATQVVICKPYYVLNYTFLNLETCLAPGDLCISFAEGVVGQCCGRAGDCNVFSAPLGYVCA